MCGTGNIARDGQGAIYTLAQNGTSESDKPAKILIGKGSDLSAKDLGKRKVKKKAITQSLILQMIDIAKKEGKTDIQKSLWNTYYCQQKVYTHENRLYSSYCKNRFCTTCLGIRKAELIKKYYPVLKDWSDPHFVTLTVKAIPRYELKKILKKCLSALNRIIDKYEKQASRGTGKKLMGIRSLESNFNPISRTYNPHLHLIVPDHKTAEILKKEWLRLWTLKPTKRKWVKPEGQDIRKVWNLDAALIEVIKYGTKIFTDPDKKKKVPGTVKIYAKAFYNIIVAMHGLRLFGSFGFTLPKRDKETTPANVTTEYEEWVYLPEFRDWQHTDSEQTLFGSIPENIILELIENQIDNLSE